MQSPSKLLVAAVSTFALISLAAQPQELQQKNSIETITVTSQKRVERLADVPLAVSVLNSEKIDVSFSNRFEDLQQLVPSVSFKKGTTSRNSAITIRGIGTISFSIAAEPSVSTVVDGVVLGRSGQAFIDLYDLERIEILRGPQGTLFGKNASAGVVNITTKRPTSETESMVEFSMFQGNEYRIKAKVQGGINDQLSASFVAFKSSYDGNLSNVYNNQKVNGYDKQGFRLMLDANTSDDGNFLFIFENTAADDNCCADIEALPSGRNPDSSAAPKSNGIVNGIADFDLNQRKVDHDFETQTIDKTMSFSVQYDKQWQDYSITSITAYREWENTEYREGDFTSIAGDSTEAVFDVPFQLHDIGPQTWHQFSQELRLASPLGARFDWLVGAFFWKVDSERSFTREASCQNNNGQFNQAISHYLETELGLTDPDEQEIANFIASENLSCNANNIVSATANMNTEFNNWALFADAKYQVSEYFKLLFGVRYTDDEIIFSHYRISNDTYGRRGVGVRPATENTNFSGETSNTNTSVKLGGQVELDDMGMIYATWSQGYKGPGYNVFYNMAEKDTLPIAEETSNAYELGYKFLSPDFMFNAALFRTEIKGFQANNFDNSSGVTITRLTNAGNVSTQGIEIDIIFQPTDNLTLTAGFAHIEAVIDEFFCPEAEQCTDRSGLDVPFSPDLKYLLALNYVTELEYMNIKWDIAYVFTDEQKATLPSNSGEFSPEVILPEYALVNASVIFSFDDDSYQLALIGKNLTDEQYFTSYSGDGFRYQVARDADRYFGIQLRMHFR
ncbi:TonB-dependent receptor [Colwellia piezophila]|uniref:TonB-dependent receptor n=1 Tax=Colwellia piezophila TaxID=211668 RepID=UPI000379C302|nr:TonB-dependent receptor [Colwellia piezophila]